MLRCDASLLPGDHRGLLREYVSENSEEIQQGNGSCKDQGCMNLRNHIREGGREGGRRRGGGGGRGDTHWESISLVLLFDFSIYIIILLRFKVRLI